MKFIKVTFLAIAILFLSPLHGQTVDFDRDIFVSKDIHLGQLGAFEGSIFGLDQLVGKNDLRFGIENQGEGIFMNNTLRVRVGRGLEEIDGALHVQDSLLLLMIAEGYNDEGSRVRIINNSIGGGTWDFLSTGETSSEGAGHLTIDQFGVAPRMIFKNDGTVGIGLLDPNDALDVAGDIDATGCIQTDDMGSIGGTCLSDRRLKRNIMTLQNQLPKVMALNPVSFEWKNPEMNGGQPLDIGFIAQEVEEVIPEMVKTDDQGVKKVRYDISLQMRVIKAMQEQQAIIEDQQNQISLQQSQIDLLKQEMTELKEILKK